MNKVIQTLPGGPLDIVGDVHGELDALESLLRQLGYEGQGYHPQNRKIVFVGDLVDRGMDCPGVIRLVRRLANAGNAFAILGNHELNILLNKPKDGTGWFLDAAQEKDRKYGNYARCPIDERDDVLEFLGSLPLVLHRSDIRIVHAAWDDDALAAVAPLKTNEVTAAFLKWETGIIAEAKQNNLYATAKAELDSVMLSDKNLEPPFLEQHAALEALKQMGNPIKILTSGVERPGTAPFYSSGSWRFVERVQWWNEYDHPTPVVIGHYWRRLKPIDRATVGKGDPDLFETVGPRDWHGKRGNVFCIDYSVGGRWSERAAGAAGGSDFKLGALRWPERMVMLDDGQSFLTAPSGD